jgi:hypothetical protein
MANRNDKHNLFISLNKVKKASFLIGIISNILIKQKQICLDLSCNNPPLSRSSLCYRPFNKGLNTANIGGFLFLFFSQCPFSSRLVLGGQYNPEHN